MYTGGQLRMCNHVCKVDLGHQQENQYDACSRPDARTRLLMHNPRVSMGIQFNDLWNFRRDGGLYNPSSRTLPLLQKHLVTQEDDAKAVYRSFVATFRNQGGNPGGVPASALFRNDCLIRVNDQAILHYAELVSSDDGLLCIEEFPVTVWNHVRGHGLVEMILNLPIHQSQSDLYVVPNNMPWCLARDHGGSWWFVKHGMQAS